MRVSQKGVTDRRRLIATAALGLGLLLSPVAVSATDYGSGVSCDFSKAYPSPGEKLTVNCTGTPGEVAVVTITSPSGKTQTLATGEIQSNGTVSIPVMVPDDLEEGVHILAVTVDNDLVATTGVNVAGTGTGNTATTSSQTSTTTGSRLPITGSNVGLLIPIAGGLLIAGGAAVSASRRNEDAPAES